MAHILGVRIDNLTHREILDKIEGFLGEPKFHQVATVNPEFILEAQKNIEFKNILSKADLNVADGVGISFSFLWNFSFLKCRMSGADLMQEILRMAEEKNLKVFLAAKKGGLSTWEETREAILKIYPKLEVEGFNFNINQDQNKNPSIRPYKEGFGRKISEYDVVFCNFGAPHQELFINSIKCDTIRLAMGVGGSFDFLTGKVRRAPVFMRKIGLEWLWRLILQPHRWKRICRAVIVFPIKVIFKKL